MSPRFRIVAAVLAISIAAAACSGKKTPSVSLKGLSAEVASYELLTSRPQRFLVGLFTSGNKLVSYGSVQMRFQGTGGTSFTTSGRFILVPEESQPLATNAQMAAAATRPTAVTEPTQARGVYEANGVTFPKPGLWQVQVTVDVSGSKATASAHFPVVSKPSYPAPGQPAPRSDNLTLAHHPGAPLTAVDSRATGNSVPDPILHKWTVAKAVAERLPTVVVVSTPLYCQSRFCGPITDEIAQIAEQFRGKKVAFIHLEVWRDYQKKVVNKAAAQWVYRNNDITEPWVFLVGSDGKIVDRWENVFDRNQLLNELDSMVSR